MDRIQFESVLKEKSEVLGQIKDLAAKIHAAVNQHYDKTLPYSYHLNAVADNAMAYGHSVCDNPEDVVPMVYGAYMHDSIEDARLTYNNVLHLASKMMDERQAHLAAEIVYALTNEKGRTRSERANDRYYHGIRTTPYAPLCKMADRMANITYSVNHDNGSNNVMRHVYAQEHPHFITSITGGAQADDARLRVPQAMIEDLEKLLTLARKTKSEALRRPQR